MSQAALLASVSPIYDSLAGMWRMLLIFGACAVLYGFSLSYLLLPAIGMPFDGPQFIDLVHSLPEWAKYSGKVLLAAPFAFHSWNGVRHLLWDSGKCKYNPLPLSMLLLMFKLPTSSSDCQRGIWYGVCGPWCHSPHHCWPPVYLSN